MVMIMKDTRLIALNRILVENLFGNSWNTGDIGR